MKTGTSGVVASAGFDCDVCGARLDAAHLDFALDGSHCVFCGAPQARRGDEAPRREVASPLDGSILDVGDALHDARLTRGETLEQAAHFTRIQPAYLRALEHDDADAFEPFPGMTYARYFLRDYAEHLEIDPGPLMRRFDSEVTTPAVTPAERPTRSRRASRARHWATGAFVVLLIAIVAGAAWSRGSLDGPVLGLSTAPSAGAGQHDGQTPQNRGRPPATAISAVIRTVHRPSWILVTVNGTVVKDKTVPVGVTLRFRSKDTLGVRLGDAGAVDLSVNGKHVNAGGSGAVADLTFALQNGRVVQR
jgi:cytoskeleton protein RodZ